RPDRLVRLLGVLGPGAVGARLVRQVAIAVVLGDLAAAGGERLARELHAVRAHVGDQADGLAVEIDPLVQALGGAHGAIGAEAELARGFLLQGAGRERRRRVALDLLLLEAVDAELPRLDRGDRALGVGLARDVEAVELLTVEAAEASLEGGALGCGERRLDAPVFLRPERLDLVLALADQAQRHRLHAPGRARALQLAPQHRRQGEPDQVIERPARLVGVDQAFVQVARMAHRLEHGALGDLVEHHALDVFAVDRAPILERREQVPGDRFAFAVRVGREVQAVGVLQRPGDLGDALLLIREQLVDDAEVFLRAHRAVLLRQIAHVAVARQHAIARAQVLVDAPGLGRGFDDDDVHAVVRFLSGVGDRRRERAAATAPLIWTRVPCAQARWRSTAKGRAAVRPAWHRVHASSTARRRLGGLGPWALPDQPGARDTRLPGWRARPPSSSRPMRARWTSAVLAWLCRISSSTRSGSGPSRSHNRPIRSPAPLVSGSFGKTA